MIDMKIKKSTQQKLDIKDTEFIMFCKNVVDTLKKVK